MLVAHYLDEVAEAVAFGFNDALEQAYAQIGRHSASGSPRYATNSTYPACVPGR